MRVNSGRHDMSAANHRSITEQLRAGSQARVACMVCRRTADTTIQVTSIFTSPQHITHTHTHTHTHTATTAHLEVVKWRHDFRVGLRHEFVREQCGSERRQEFTGHAEWSEVGGVVVIEVQQELHHCHWVVLDPRRLTLLQVSKQSIYVVEQSQ